MKFGKNGSALQGDIVRRAIFSIFVSGGWQEILKYLSNGYALPEGFYLYIWGSGFFPIDT